MQVENLIKILGAEFYTGVPDSQLKPFCDYLIENYGINPKHHVIGANEGNCTALAAGYHLATGKIPVVYLQNSGQGNIINPVASLLNNKVYAIPVIFIIGWRGEPMVHDEPQHIFQGEITLKLLEDIGIAYFVISKETTFDEISSQMQKFSKILKQGKSIAFVIKKGALSYDKQVTYQNENQLKREEIINHIVKYANEDLIISTTGKASRELFEIREQNAQSHKYDFLTVGSMGHSSSIALGVAINTPYKKVWCIDGDGALLMHLGAMALVGANEPKNFVHIVINNSAHETVGGMPTVANNINITGLAKSLGYINTLSVNNIKDLDDALDFVKKSNELSLIEVKCAIGARKNLGRPTSTPIENKISFMNYIQSDEKIKINLNS